MQWYFSKNGNQLGPVEENELRAKISSGEISPSNLVWREGMTEWLPASSAPGLVAGPPAVSPYQPPNSQPAMMPYSGAPIPNYLWQSICVTIFCCWPFGIPAIVYAAKVDGLKAKGDIAGAMTASASAKTWCLVAAGSWIVGIVLVVVLGGLGAVFGNN